MDEAKFQKGVQTCREIRAALEALGSTSPENIAATYRKANRSDLLSALIQLSTESRIIWDGVQLIAKRLREDGQPLPRELTDWSVDVATDIQPRPKGRGKDRRANWPRDQVIGVAVHVLKTEHGFRPTRNITISPYASPEGGSACDAAGVAFKVGGYKAVEKIWLENKPDRNTLHILSMSHAKLANK